MSAMGGLQSYFNALPLFSRYLLASGGIAMLASVITAYRITKVLALAPYFVVRKAQLWRLVTSPWASSSFFASLIDLFFTWRVVPPLEEELGTLNMLSHFMVLTLLANTLSCSLCVLLAPVFPSLLAPPTPIYLTIGEAQHLAGSLMGESTLATTSAMGEDPMPLQSASRQIGTRIFSHGGLRDLVLFCIVLTTQRFPRPSINFLGCFEVPKQYFPLLILAIFGFMEEDFLNYAVAVAIGYAYHYGHLSLFFPGAQRLIGWEERSELSSVMTQPGYVTMANRTGNPTLPLFGQSHMSQSPHFSQLINQQLSRLSSQAQQPVETDQNSSAFSGLSYTLRSGGNAATEGSVSTPAVSSPADEVNDVSAEVRPRYSMSPFTAQAALA